MSEAADMRCRRCGCTELSACLIHAPESGGGAGWTWEPCAWAQVHEDEEPLCTACVDDGAQALRYVEVERALQLALHVKCGGLEYERLLARIRESLTLRGIELDEDDLGAVLYEAVRER